MTVTDLIDAFLRDRQRNGCRPATLRVYRSGLEPLRRQFGPRPFADITRLELKEFIDQQSHWPDRHKDRSKRGQLKRPDTIRLILARLAMLQSFAIDHEVIDEAILKPKDLKKPKSRRRERLATQEETDKLLTIASPAFRRIYEALRRTGARPIELCQAKITDIRTEDGRRTIELAHHKTSDKDGSTRHIPISPAVAPWFDAAIGDRQTGPIFLNTRGHAWTRNQLTATFRKLRRQIGLPESLKLYCARHEFGSAVAKKHGLFEAKELLGHADIATTQRYAHMQDAERHAAQQDLYDDDSPTAA